MKIDLCSLHFEIKSESNLIIEEQRNYLSHGFYSSFPSLSIREGSDFSSMSMERGQGFFKIELKIK